MVLDARFREHDGGKTLEFFCKRPILSRQFSLGMISFLKRLREEMTFS